MIVGNVSTSLPNNNKMDISQLLCDQTNIYNYYDLGDTLPLTSPPSLTEKYVAQLGKRVTYNGHDPKLSRKVMCLCIRRGNPQSTYWAYDSFLPLTNASSHKTMWKTIIEVTLRCCALPNMTILHNVHVLSKGTGSHSIYSYLTAVHIVTSCVKDSYCDYLHCAYKIMDVSSVVYNAYNIRSDILTHTMRNCYLNGDTTSYLEWLKIMEQNNVNYMDVWYGLLPRRSNRKNTYFHIFDEIIKEHHTLSPSVFMLAYALKGYGDDTLNNLIAVDRPTIGNYDILVSCFNDNRGVFGVPRVINLNDTVTTQYVTDELLLYNNVNVTTYASDNVKEVVLYRLGNNR